MMELTWMRGPHLSSRRRLPMQSAKKEPPVGSGRVHGCWPERLLAIGQRMSACPGGSVLCAWHHGFDLLCTGLPAVLLQRIAGMLKRGQQRAETRSDRIKGVHLHARSADGLRGKSHRVHA